MCHMTEGGNVGSSFTCFLFSDSSPHARYVIPNRANFNMNSDLLCGYSFVWERYKMKPDKRASKRFKTEQKQLN